LCIKAINHEANYTGVTFLNQGGGFMDFDDLSYKVIGCAIEVHKHLGPGLLESSYEKCLAYELSISNIPYKQQLALPIRYKSVEIDCAYRLDLIIDEQLIVELKSVSHLTAIHEAQILTYMKLANISTGLLINFNEVILKRGVKRFKLGLLVYLRVLCVAQRLRGEYVFVGC
jgi:GxxExxY protein